MRTEGRDAKATIVPQFAPFSLPSTPEEMAGVPNPIHGHGFISFLFPGHPRSDLGIICPSGETMSRMRGCHGLELGRSISPRSHVHLTLFRGGGACVRACEREITETLILIFG